MSRLVAFVVSLFALVAFSVQPAQAMTDNEATLIYLGPVSSKYISKPSCTNASYRIDNTVWFSLEYLGSDHRWYYAEASGKWDSGIISICPQSNWPKGYYWLRKVIMENYDGISYYERHTGNVIYSDGDVQKHGLNLSRSDFTIR